jgi:hypothetical protein
MDQAQGSSSQQPIFYDQSTGQFYTMENQYKNDNPLAAMFGNMLGDKNKRNYIGNPNGMGSYTQPDATVAPYPTTESILPTMNASLLSSSALGDASSGAGRYLTPSLLATMSESSKSSSKK